MGKSIVRCQMQSRERRWLPLPALIGLLSLQPAIPWQVGLHQSPPPLHRPGSECVTVVVPVENFAANGQQCLIRLSQPRGPPQSLDMELGLLILMMDVRTSKVILYPDYYW